MTRQRYLLDTCICIAWLRDKYGIRERINTVGLDNCYISEMTVIPIATIFDHYAGEKARLTLMGKPTGEFDLLIGSTAVANKMIMVTENVDDFKNIKDIQIENWIDRSKT